MPKKPPRNGFYYYMQWYKSDQQKQGITYANLKEVADAAGPSWATLPKSEKDRYNAIAKQEKQSAGLDTKFTSLGESFADVDRREQEQREMVQREIQDIKNITRTKNSIELAQEDFFLMDVNWYCCTNNGEYVICECSLLSFNIQDGIKDIYHEIINPGAIPLGYTSDAKEGSIDLAIPLPDDAEPITDSTKTLSRIVAHLKKHEKDGVIAPVFTMPEKVPAIVNFIMKMCHAIGTDEAVFRVYKLPTFFFYLKNSFAKTTEECFPKESLALAALQRDLYQTSPYIACEHHELADRAVVCSMSRVKRWAYTVFDECCELANVTMVPGKHLPESTDLDAIILYRERNQEKLKTAEEAMQKYYSSDMPPKPKVKTSAPVIKTSQGADRLPILEKPTFRRADKVLTQAATSAPPNLTDIERFPVSISSSRGGAARNIGRGLGPTNVPMPIGKIWGRGPASQPPALSETDFPAISKGRGARRLGANLGNTDQ